MRRFVIALVTCLGACAHDKLDFGLPDAGGAQSIERRHGGADSGLSSCQGPMCPSDIGAADGDDTYDSILDAALAAHGAKPFGALDAGSNRTEGPTDEQHNGQVEVDPNGYPTPPGQQAPWCDQGQPIDEVCGNAVDDDCDGTVDEFSGGGEPCRIACGDGIYSPGIYVCDVATNSLSCQPSSPDCIMPASNPPRCGDTVVDPGEQCDPADPKERAGITCTSDCRRPLFVRCLIDGMLEPDICDPLHACSERIGACVPVISAMQPRCPEIPIEAGGSEFYPMLETEDGQCWLTCLDSSTCPSPISDCYMGFCAVPL